MADDKDKKDAIADNCANCRWAEFKAQLYGAIDYTCGRRQEPLASTTLTKRRCSEHER